MPPAPFDRNQVPSRDPGSNQEFIRLHNGTRRLVREWDVAARAWKYTALGKRFFSQKTVEYVVKVPVIIEGSHRDARGTYEKRTHLPVDLFGMGKLQVSALLSDDEAREHLRRVSCPTSDTTQSSRQVSVWSSTDFPRKNTSTTPGATG